MARWRTTFDAKRAGVTGQPQTLVEKVGRLVRDAMPAASVSGNGVLVYRHAFFFVKV